MAAFAGHLLSLSLPTEALSNFHCHSSALKATATPQHFAASGRHSAQPSPSALHCSEQENASLCLAQSGGKGPAGDWGSDQVLGAFGCKRQASVWPAGLLFQGPDRFQFTEGSRNKGHILLLAWASLKTHTYLLPQPPKQSGIPHKRAVPSGEEVFMNILETTTTKTRTKTKPAARASIWSISNLVRVFRPSRQHGHSPWRVRKETHSLKQQHSVSLYLGNWDNKASAHNFSNQMKSKKCATRVGVGWTWPGRRSTRESPRRGSWLVFLHLPKNC